MWPVRYGFTVAQAGLRSRTSRPCNFNEATRDRRFFPRLAVPPFLAAALMAVISSAARLVCPGFLESSLIGSDSIRTGLESFMVTRFVRANRLPLRAKTL
jgi:hypothetical protein